MLDLKLIEKQPEVIRLNLKNRGQDPSMVDEVLALNKNRKNLISQTEAQQAQIKKLSKLVGQNQGNQETVQNYKAQVLQLKTEQKSLQENLEKVETELNNLLLNLPNLLDPQVPVGHGEEDNVVLKTVGEIPQFNFKVKDHASLGEELNQLNFEEAAKITGTRFVVYKGQLAQLERALINFMLDYHLKNGYEEVIPPVMVKGESLVGTGNLPKFKDQLFKIEGQDWYLIPTAEVPLTNLLREQIITAPFVNKKYVAVTPCFRSEAGAHGKDVKGLIRLHQFNKVEMVQITHPQNSQAAHKEMINSAAEILSILGLPYRLIHLCSADTGFGSTNTVDLEVWLPSQNKYREISSVSNCGDFQARRAQIRYKENNQLSFAHTLNGSGLAVGRTVVAIMENYQQSDGSIIIPSVLVPYMRGQTKINRL